MPTAGLQPRPAGLPSPAFPWPQTRDEPQNRHHHLSLLRRRLRRGCQPVRRRSHREIARHAGSPGQSRQALFQGLGTGGNRLHRRSPAASSGKRPENELGRSPRNRRRTLPLDRRRTRPRGRGPVCLRPVADRGLLCRQQADEGLHRLGQHRHQLAPVHVFGGRRAETRLRLGHGAGQLRRPGPGRPDPACRLQYRLVPPGAVSAHRARAQGTGRQRPPPARGGDRPAENRQLRYRRSAPAPATGHRCGAVQRPAGLAARPGTRRCPVRAGTHRRFRGSPAHRPLVCALPDGRGRALRPAHRTGRNPVSLV